MEKQAVGVLSRFVVANDMDAALKRAFVLRPHLVDNAPGFVRMDVLSPEDMPNEIWLMTYWVDLPAIEHGIKATLFMDRMREYRRD